MDYITCMQSFIQTAKQKSFSKAARALNLPPSQITKQIQWLENKLEVKLFERTTKINKLTQAGETFFEYALQISQSIKNAHQALGQIKKEPSGRLAISAPSTLNRIQLIEITTDFIIKYPKIQVILNNLNSPYSVLDENTDIAISSVNLLNNNIIKTHLFSLKQSLFASPGYLKKKSTPSKCEELKNHLCIVNIKETPNLYWTTKYNQKIQINPSYLTDTTDSMLIPAIRGLGIIWVSNSFVQNELDKDLLVEIDIDEFKTELPVYMYHKQVNKGSIIRLFADFIENYLKNL